MIFTVIPLPVYEIMSTLQKTLPQSKQCVTNCFAKQITFRRPYYLFRISILFLYYWYIFICKVLGIQPGKSVVVASASALSNQFFGNLTKSYHWVLFTVESLFESRTLFRIRLLEPGLNSSQDSIQVRTLFNFRNFKVILCKNFIKNQCLD